MLCRVVLVLSRLVLALPFVVSCCTCIVLCCVVLSRDVWSCYLYSFLDEIFWNWIKQNLFSTFQECFVSTMAPRGHLFHSNCFTSTTDIFYFCKFPFFHFQPFFTSNFFFTSTFFFTSNFFFTLKCFFYFQLFFLFPTFFLLQTFFFTSITIFLFP